MPQKRKNPATPQDFVSPGRVLPWFLLVFGLALIIAAGVLVAYRHSARQEEFVTRDGAALYLRGQPYRFGGFSVAGFFGCGAEHGWPIGSRQLDQYFAALPPGAMTKINYYDIKHAGQLEQIVRTARRYGQKLAVSFASHTPLCGQALKTNDWYANGYQGSYLTRVRQTVRAYQNEPAIAIWEPISLPSGDTQTVARFFDRVAGFIKREAPRQLVSSGTGLPVDDASAARYRAVNGQAAVDVAGGYALADGKPVPSAAFTRALQALEGLHKPMLAQWHQTAGAAQAAGTPGSNCAGYPTRARLAGDVMNSLFDKPVVAGVLHAHLVADDNRPCAATVTLGNDDGLFAAVNAFQIPGIPAMASGLAGGVIDRLTPDGASAASAASADSAEPAAPAPADTTDTDAPSGLRPVVVTSNAVTFAWDPWQKGQIQPSGYNIFRNGVIAATSLAANYTDTGLGPDTAYTYKVSAYDNQGGISAESPVLTVLTTTPGAASGDAGKPFAIAAAGMSNLLPVAAGDQPRVSGVIAVANPDAPDADIARAELLVNKRLRAAADQPPFALQFDTQTLTNAAHQVSYRLRLADGTTVTSSRTIVARNDLNLFERVRNAALEPLAGSSGVFLNSIFIGMAVVALAVPVLVIAAFRKLHGIENRAQKYRQRNFWGNE